jgi:hypothetical protein
MAKVPPFSKPIEATATPAASAPGHAPEGGADAARAAALLADHPAWAIWLPAPGRGWTAVRPASSRPPGPGLPMLWADAATADELARIMSALDEQVSPGGWP